jgi:hypothetical protein
MIWRYLSLPSINFICFFLFNFIYCVSFILCYFFSFERDLFSLMLSNEYYRKWKRIQKCVFRDLCLFRRFLKDLHSMLCFILYLIQWLPFLEQISTRISGEKIESYNNFIDAIALKSTMHFFLSSSFLFLLNMHWLHLYITCITMCNLIGLLFYVYMHIYIHLYKSIDVPICDRCTWCESNYIFFTNYIEFINRVSWVISTTA